MQDKKAFTSGKEVGPNSKRPAFAKCALLPIFCGIIPVLFLYSHNVMIVEASSLVFPLLLMVFLSVIVFGLLYALHRDFIVAAFSACFVLVFFHLYGAFYSKLFAADLIQIENYTLIPFLILVAIYGGMLFARISRPVSRQLFDIAFLVSGALVVINIALAVPGELQKAQTRASAERAVQPTRAAAANYPDIYFIIFDEYAGFDALREYWKDDGHLDFIAFLEQKGFFVAEHSRSKTTDTLVEIASRLNLKEYESNNKDYTELFEAISNNKVMEMLKSYGYTTVVFDGPSIPYKTKPPITADFDLNYEGSPIIENYSVTYDDSPIPADRRFEIDEFATLFLNQTMLRGYLRLHPTQGFFNSSNRKMVLFSLAKAVDLDEVPTPKFVYLHVMLPHMPMMFDENGLPVNDKHLIDWTYYLGQHKYATKRAMQLVDQILKESDPKRPPIIILQSDHGARNHKDESADTVLLPNYDDRHKTSILNALYLPGYDYSQLTDNLEPIQTFAIVLNHYFNAGVTIERLPPE